MNPTMLLEALTELDDDYILSAWERLSGSAKAGKIRASGWRIAWIAAVLALVLSSFTAAAALGADFRDFGKALVRPVSLLRMIYIVGFLNGFRAPTFGYLLFASFGAGMRLLVSERRDFWILGLSAPAIYALCELMIQSNQDYYFGLPYPAGVFALWFAVGYWLCTLILLARRIIRRKSPARERKLVIAAIALLLLSSFTMAMAANADFRETVFSVFHIGQTETLPDDPGAADEGQIDPVGGQTLEDAVKTYYFHGSGVIRIDDGMIYASQYDREGGVFYDLDDTGLKPLDTQCADFHYTFRGTDFHIAYDYAVYDGRLFLRPKVDPIVNEDPYKYDWNLLSPGIDARTAWLLLPYLDGGEYGVYPLQLDVQSHEITDVLQAVSFEDLHPAAWWFSENGNWAICRDFTAAWLCDLRNGALTPLSELVGRSVQESYFLDADTILCHAENDTGFDVIRLDPASGETAVVAENMRRADASGDGSGYREIQYHGAPGKHALLCETDGAMRLLDLRDGTSIPLSDLPPGDLLTFESPDGKYILFVWKDKAAADAKAMRSIGVLDTASGEMKLLDRENPQPREEHLVSWLSNDCFVIVSFDETDDSGWYLYVYDFR